MYLPAIDFAGSLRLSTDTIMVGIGDWPATSAPDETVMLTFDAGTIEAPATVTVHPPFDRDLPSEILGRSVVIEATRSMLEVMFGRRCPTRLECFHLSPSLRAIIVAMQACRLSGGARDLYLRAKGVELLCDTMTALECDGLVGAIEETSLFREDTARLLAARDFVERNWRSGPTIDQIGRACGIGRSKLTIGFRALFGLSVYETITARRFDEAKLLLATTDMHVATIGYAVGYESSASFTRAFTKWVGLSPAKYRGARC